MTNSTDDRESWLRSLPRELARLCAGADSDGGVFPESLGGELAALGWALLELDTGADPAAARERLRSALAALRLRLQGTAPASEQLGPLIAAVNNLTGSWPQLGPLAPAQADLERLKRAGERYGQALSDWTERLLGVGEASIAEFEQRLGEDDDPRATAALVDLWCEITEARYEAELDTAAHANAYAELVNAGSELRLAGFAVLDPALEAMGLPNRRALEDAQARLDRVAREQRRSMAELRQRLDAMTGGNGGHRGGAG